MKAVLFDTNILLDGLLQRQPWAPSVNALWQANEDGILRACIASTSLTNIFYIVRKVSDRARAEHAIDACLDAFTLLPIDAYVMSLARSINGGDFEDDVLLAAALRWGTEAIITRDPRGFRKATIPVLSPEQGQVLYLGAPP